MKTAFRDQYPLIASAAVLAPPACQWSESSVVLQLWGSEVLHVLRLCFLTPDP